MPLRIVVDVRRVRDFGIGTYIRSLLHALAGIDQSGDYTLVSLPEDVRTFSGLPPNFKAVAYPKTDSYYLNHVAFPLFLRRLAPDLVHIPLNQVPLFMPRPYVVTVHDMANLLFETGSGLRMDSRRFLLRRGLLRAHCVIAVSEATPKTASAWSTTPPTRSSSARPGPPTRARPVRSAKNSSAPASWSVTRSTIRSCSMRATSGRRRTSRGWWRPSRWFASSFRAIPPTRTCT
jgi:hypothetical protein